MSERRSWRIATIEDSEIFAANRCDVCVNDRFDHETGESDSCPIWMNALIDVDDDHLFWDSENQHGECDLFHPRAEIVNHTLGEVLKAVGELYQAERDEMSSDACDWVDEVIIVINALRGGK